MQRTIEFHGEAAKKWGKTHTIDADTTFMAFRGLVNILGNDFREYVRQNKFRILKNKNSQIKKNALSEMQVHQELEDTKVLHVVPIIQGAGAVFRIIIGVILLVAACFGYGNPYTVSLGVSLIMGGIAQLMAPHPSSGSNGASLTSYNFTGPANNTQQGGPVPLVYGKVGNCGGTIISIGLTYEKP
jgi:predicted phage tail protein